MSKNIDVLAVLARLITLAADDCPPEPSDPDGIEYDEWARAYHLLSEAREARAAVEELIEKASRAASLLVFLHHGDFAITTDLVAAIAGVKPA